MQPDVQVQSLVQRLGTEHGGCSHHKWVLFYFISGAIYVTGPQVTEFSSWTCPLLMVCFLESSGTKWGFRELLRYWGVTWDIFHTKEITEESCTHLQPRKNPWSGWAEWGDGVHEGHGRQNTRRTSGEELEYNAPRKRDVKEEVACYIWRKLISGDGGGQVETENAHLSWLKVVWLSC